MTRAGAQAGSLEERLREAGGTVLSVPAIEIRPIPPSAEHLQAVERLGTTDLVVFTSANAVRCFAALLEATGGSPAVLTGMRLAAIGPETAASLRVLGAEPAIEAAESTSEGLVGALADQDLAGRRVLIPRARVARDLLPADLRRRGAEVEVLAVYETVVPEGLTPGLRAAFAGGVDAIAFTSGSTVRNVVAALGAAGIGMPPSTLIACIGPATAAAAREAGLAVDIIARESTAGGLARAIAEVVTRGRQSP